MDRLRERIAPYVPYWPWAVIPALILALIVQEFQSSAQSERLDLMRDNVTALQRQITALKKGHDNSPAALLARLGEPGEPRHARDPSEGARRPEARAGRPPPGAVPRRRGGRRHHHDASAPTDAPADDPSLDGDPGDPANP